MGRDRNYPCPCGSGLKYKRCCEGKRTKQLPGGTLFVVLVVVVSMGVAGAAFISAFNAGVPAGKVWSVEHGHWHDKNQNAAYNPSGEPVPQPPGPVPLAKVWSPEHGHWHDVFPGATNTPAPRPPGPAPAGKVWFTPHGHWHDLS